MHNFQEVSNAFIHDNGIRLIANGGERVLCNAMTANEVS